MLIDLFTYTHRTARQGNSEAALIQRALDKGLDGICIVDHEHSRDAAKLVALGQDAGLFVGVGVRITTTEGWIVGLPPAVDAVLGDEQWRALNAFARPGAQDVVDYFNDLGGAAIAMALYDRRNDFSMGDQVFALRGLAAIDVLDPNRNRLENDFALEASSALGLPGAGGSHALQSARHVGEVATIFAHAVKTQQDLVENLKGVEYWAVRQSTPEQRRERRAKEREKSDERRNARAQAREERERRREERRGGGGRRRSSREDRDGKRGDDGERRGRKSRQDRRERRDDSGGGERRQRRSRRGDRSEKR